MAYDEYLSERVAKVLDESKATFYEKKMFGGICFMVEEKMCYDIVKYDLMVRLNPDIADQIESKMGCRPMDFTGKRIKGYYYINPKGVDLQVDLEYLVQLALEFNPLAKASKKKTKIKI